MLGETRLVHLRGLRGSCSRRRRCATHPSRLARLPTRRSAAWVRSGRRLFLRRLRFQFCVGEQPLPVVALVQFAGARRVGAVGVVQLVVEPDRRCRCCRSLRATPRCRRDCSARARRRSRRGRGLRCTADGGVVVGARSASPCGVCNGVVVVVLVAQNRVPRRAASGRSAGESLAAHWFASLSAAG